MITSALACSNSTPQTSTATQATTSVQPITLVFTLFEAPNSVQSTGVLIPYIDEVEKRTGGRVKLEAHWNGELASLPDTYNAVLDGTVDLGYAIPAMNPGLFDMDQIMNFCRYDSICWKPSRVYFELTQQFPEIQAQYKDVKVLYHGASNQPGIGFNKKQVTRLEDLKGVKMLTSSMIAGARFEKKRGRKEVFERQIS